VSLAHNSSTIWGAFTEGNQQPHIFFPKPELRLFLRQYAEGNQAKPNPICFASMSGSGHSGIFIILCAANGFGICISRLGGHGLLGGIGGLCAGFGLHVRYMDQAAVESLVR